MKKLSKKSVKSMMYKNQKELTGWEGRHINVIKMENKSTRTSKFMSILKSQLCRDWSRKL